MNDSRCAMTDPERLRKGAERLFALALQARGQGDVELADRLTERALLYLDEVSDYCDADDPPLVAAPITPRERQQHQKQLEQDGEPE